MKAVRSSYYHMCIGSLFTGLTAVAVVQHVVMVLIARFTLDI